MKTPAEKGYTYILRCRDGTLYCGWTNDLTARLAAHNSGRGAKYTRGRGPVRLVYSELFATQSEAMQREAAVKRLTRAQKEALLLTQTGGELLTVYDADGRPCGERPRAVVHAQGLFHQVCHLWIAGVRNGVPGLWLQQRGHDRPLYPGQFDLAATGHLDPGETPADAALREAREETGLRLSPDALIPAEACRQRYVRADGGFDDELAFPFLTRADGVPPFAPGSEVERMVFVSLADFARVHEAQADLPAADEAGQALVLPHGRLCCLHESEWQAVRGPLAALLNT